MTPTPTSGAADLPEALRVPLDSLHADAGYLCGRLLNGSLTQEQVVESIRRRIDAAKLAALTAQALSAAPAVPAGWKAVPVNPTPEMWKAAKTVPDPNPPYPPHYGLVWDAMLAASPTPPAAQQAAQVIIDFSQVGTAGPFPVANGRVSLPDATMQDLARMLRPTYEAEQQAAPKAAPGEPDGFGSAEHWKERAQYWAGVAHRLRGEALRGEPVDGIVHPPAPQQEAQEPCPSCRNSDIYACTCTFPTSRNAAPQPAPAPLSDAQIAEMMRDTWGCASIAPRHAMKFARAIEAAHGIGIKGGQHGTE